MSAALEDGEALPQKGEAVRAAREAHSPAPFSGPL